MANSPPRTKSKVAPTTDRPTDRPTSQLRSKPSTVRPVWTRPSDLGRLPDVQAKPSELTSQPTKEKRLRKLTNELTRPIDLAQAKDDRTQTIRVVLMAVMLVLILLGLSDPSFNMRKSVSGLLGKDTADAAARSSSAGNSSHEALQNRVDFHRGEIGRRLNRERINSAYENETTAPPVAVDGNPVKLQAPDMMRGVPLIPEAAHRVSSRDRTVPDGPDFTDSRTLHSLQEEQAAQEADRLERKRYIEEFIANAARGGYKVRVDADGRVVVLGQPSEATANGARPPANLILPETLRQPASGANSGTNLPQ